MALSREELEKAFQHYWRTGAVGEDWDAWADLFTEDATYVEHVLGNLKGREEIRAWIKPIMEQFGELYTVYEWHVVDEATGRVVVYMQNRRDHPNGQGPSTSPASRSCNTPATTGGAWKKIFGRCRRRTPPSTPTPRPAASSTPSTSRNARVTTGGTDRRGRRAEEPTTTASERRDRYHSLRRIAWPPG